MKRMLVLIVAAGLWLGLAAESDAQFSMAIGNPYAGGFAMGVPYGGYGAGVYAPYGGVGVLPAASYYSSGYSGVYPGVAAYRPSYYAAAPVVAAYAYPSYGYGYRSVYGMAPYRRMGYYGGFGRPGLGFGGIGVGRVWGGGFR